MSWGVQRPDESGRVGVTVLGMVSDGSGGHGRSSRAENEPRWEWWAR